MPGSGGEVLFAGLDSGFWTGLDSGSLLCSPAESSNGNPDVHSSYLSIPTCGELIQYIVDENIESKAGEGKNICLGSFLVIQ